jgi:DNA repair protein RecO
VRHPLTESSWIVGLLTRETGHVRAVAKAARQVKSPFRGALEPMNLVWVQIRQKEGQELGQVNGATLMESNLDLHARWPEAGLLMAAAEVLERGLPEHSREEESFRLLGTFLKGVRSGVSPLCAWAYFLTWFLRLHGVMPSPTDPEARAALEAFLRSPLPELAGQTFSPRALRSLKNGVYLALCAYLGRPLVSEDAVADI